MRPCYWYCALISLAILASGCGRMENSSGDRQSMQTRDAFSAVTAATAPAEDAEEGPAGRLSSSTKTAPAASGVDRKLVFRAEIDLAVEDFNGFARRLDELLQEFEAYVAHSSLAGLPDAPRRGEWRIRVPVAQFKGLRQAIEGVGEVHRIQTSSEDVSEEFFDVEARIRNAQHEEARLVALLEDRAATLEAVLSVEREIARVRGEIERMQGRLRVLGSLSALSTIELRVDELRGYLPEQSPSFAVRLERSFGGSLAALGRLLQSFVMALALAMPWLIFWGLPAALIAVLLRRVRRRCVATVSG